MLACLFCLHDWFAQVVELVCDHNHRPPWPEGLTGILQQLQLLACECWDRSASMCEEGNHCVFARLPV